MQHIKIKVKVQHYQKIRKINDLIKTFITITSVMHAPYSSFSFFFLFPPNTKKGVGDIDLEVKSCNYK